MTIAEQSQMFDERIESRIFIDELQDEIITLKSQLAKSEWSREHERLYFVKRSGLIKKILSQPLSEPNRVSVARILQETEAHYDTAVELSSIKDELVANHSP